MPKNKIRAFFHYHPTFYHLHVHFTHVKLTKKVSLQVGRAISLHEVIDNIENFSPDKEKGDFYQKKSIVIEIKVGTKLHKSFVEEGLV